MRKLLLGVFCNLVVASLANAAFVPCPGTPVNNVGPSTVFTCGGLTFDQFLISPTGGLAGAQLNIGSIGTGVNNQIEVDLDFQLAGVTGNVGDLLLFYRITGGITGIDLHFTAGASNGNVHIFDTACTQAFVAGNCPVGSGAIQLANIDGQSSGLPVDISSAVFPMTNVVYIKKDVQFNGDSLSDFVQSTTAIPEPLSFLMLGGGLAFLGFIGLRRKK
jgi:hypothetical protein